MRVKWRPSLRAILLLINLIVMLLPLGGIVWLRLYESALVRQTESELLTQGTVVAASFKAELLGNAPEDIDDAQGDAPEWQARLPHLDLSADAIHPRPADAVVTSLQPEPSAAEAGRRFNAVLREVRLHTLAGIRIVDRQGIVVASTAGDINWQLQQEEVARALKGETVSLLRERHTDEQGFGPLSRATRIRVFVALPLMQDGAVLGAVLLARTPASLWDTLKGKMRPLAYAAAALLAIVLMLSWLTTRTIARPIRELREQAERAAAGASGAVTPLRHAGTREVAQLSDSLTAMANTLEQRADYIRKFAAQVSHEFKTPLTSIRGAVELLTEHNDDLSREERERFHHIIATDADRLDRLVRRLLELARADVAKPGSDDCDPLAVLRSCVARARELGLTVDVQIPESVMTSRIPAEDLEAVFNNLLDNIRHHAAGSVATVSALVADGSLTVCLADDGPGISPANAAQIFEPFFTTARNSGSTGLGLAIVRALLNAYGGDVRLKATDRGTMVALSLPVR
ncbi:MAG: HAMP domain-containing histidine kinase [Pseudomonadota bacterium]|nr:HAMP domain-containing histidine kinase [Pseudomonadota bacterium]